MIFCNSFLNVTTRAMLHKIIKIILSLFNQRRQHSKKKISSIFLTFTLQESDKLSRSKLKIGWKNTDAESTEALYTQAASKTRKKRELEARIEETKRNSITTYLPTRGDRDPPFQRFFSKTLALRANSSRCVTFRSSCTPLETEKGEAELIAGKRVTLQNFL